MGLLVCILSYEYLTVLARGPSQHGIGADVFLVPTRRLKT